ILGDRLMERPGNYVDDIVWAASGDANKDDYVNVSDLGILATHYGTTSGAEWGEGDFNGDNMVDVSDLGALATNYGIVPTQAVPEPSTLVGLLGVCLGGLSAAGRRNRRR
ncbi:MAG: CRISPR-associated protein Cas5, partial [Planctomycetota bacterium]|nr:CRISPR-associated protein Cas5 [Planctomycetota bacterium]